MSEVYGSDFEQRVLDASLSFMAENWGRGEGPYWCDDIALPDMRRMWFRSEDGRYVEFAARHPRGTSSYHFAPWPHCALCDQKLKKVGPNARCGRENLPGTQSSDTNPDPCDVCCETGRILCATCCQVDRSESFVSKVRNLSTLRGSAEDAGEEVCYFVEGKGTGLVKIGYTASFKNRFRALSTMSPTELVVLGVFVGGRELETSLHRRLRPQRRHGEWFELQGDVEKELDKLREAGLSVEGKTKPSAAAKIRSLLHVMRRELPLAQYPKDDSWWEIIREVRQ